jgi:histidine triad (HIT) family protein
MGLEVPHAHIHLIPFTQMSELNFANPKLELTNEVFAGTAAEIGKAFDSLN